MYIHRIQKLIDHLNNIPAEVFNMSSWGTVTEGRATLSDCETMEQAAECGMSACLGGHAALALPEVLQMKATRWGREKVRDATVTVREDALKADGIDVSKLTDGQFIWIDANAISYALDLCRGCARNLTAWNAPHTTAAKAAETLQRILDGKPWDTADEGQRLTDPVTCHHIEFECDGAPCDENGAAW